MIFDIATQLTFSIEDDFGHHISDLTLFLFLASREH